MYELARLSSNRKQAIGGRLSVAANKYQSILSQPEPPAHIVDIGSRVKIQEGCYRSQCRNKTPAESCQLTLYRLYL